jgi:hypothetical protein
MRDLELEHVLALPTVARISRGIKTTCAGCDGAIKDDFFFAGFAQGHPNRMFHWKCLDENAQAICEWPKCQVCDKPVESGAGRLLNGNYIHTSCEPA